MNALQISLIVLAIIAVGAILFYNWLQERKYRKQWTETFGHQEDVLLNNSDRNNSDRRIDPIVHEPSDAGRTMDESQPVAQRFDSVAVPAGQPASAKVVEQTPAADEEPAVSATEPADSVPTAIDPVTADLPPAPADTALDFTIDIHTADAMPGSAFAKLMDNQRTEGRTVHWWGYAPDFANWVEISPWRDQEFTEVAIAMQLADRSGAVGERQLFALGQDAAALAADFNGVAHWRDIGEEVIKARELDQFCVEVDVLIGLNVVSPDGVTFGGAIIAELAESEGMKLNDAGVYQRFNERGDVVYSLCNHEDTPFSIGHMHTLATHGITLLFEVPRVSNGVEMFADMAKFGFLLARTLNGRLVDDNIRTLSVAGIEKIQAQLTEIYRQMQARGIPAGGQRALRLFN